MTFRLFPKAPKFFEFFREQNRIIVEAATILDTIAQDFSGCDVRCQMVNRLEAQGDALNRTISQLLSTTFITPIDREDIYLLTTRADDIIDEINGLARRLEIVRAVPLRPDVPEVAGILAEALVEVEAAFGRLQGRNGVTDHSRTVRRLEKRADVLYAESLHRLFTEEPNAVEVVKWVSIYEQLEDAIDRCKHLAESLESVVVKHS
jgi:hypothetical protein